MNFQLFIYFQLMKDQLFHSNPLFSSNNILKFGDKITLITLYYFRQ